MLLNLVASRRLGGLSELLNGPPLTLFIRSINMGWAGATGSGGQQTAATHVLLVQPRNRRDLPEASSLVEALGGGPPSAVATVGHSRWGAA